MGSATSIGRWRVLAYCACLLLIVLYASVGWLVLNPQPSAEHRAYYIDQSIDCYPGPDGLNYEPGQRIDFSGDPGENLAAECRSSGWYSAEEWGRWSEGSTARLVIAMNGPVPPALELRMKAIAWSPDRYQNVTVYVNGEEISQLQIEAEGSNTDVYSVRLPQRVVAERSPTTVEFVIESPARPEQIEDGSITRRIGIGVEWIELSAANRSSEAHQPARKSTS